MKKTISLLITFIIIFSISACVSADKPNLSIGTYVYEGEGFGGDFTITIYDDGTFGYYVGMLSSYIGMGEWTLDGNILCLRDNVTESLPYVNYFLVYTDKLVFVENESTNFMYLQVGDGESFIFQNQG